MNFTILNFNLFKFNFSMINHFFDFDSKLNKDMFDIAECFKGKDLKKFGIKFTYPQGVSRFMFDF
jgi:hypothetical protein